MQIIETATGEDVIVAPHGHERVTLQIQCARFGGIANVRLTHEQTASLATALAGIVLDYGVSDWCLPDDS